MSFHSKNIFLVFSLIFLSLTSYSQENLIKQTDTLKNKGLIKSPLSWKYKDTSNKTRKPVFKFGNIVLASNFQYQNGVYLNQKTNNFIVRNTGNISYSLFGLPLQNTFFLINENGKLSHGINRFSLKFDKSKFSRDWQGLVNDVNKQASQEKQNIYNQINRSKSKKDSLKFVLKREKDKLNQDLLSRKDTLTDSLDYKSKQQRLDSLKQSIVQKEKEINHLIETVEQFKKVDSLRQLRNVRPSDLKKYAKLSSIQKIFSSINTLEIGTFTPRYPKLLLGGLPLKGANIEAQIGAIYIAAARGSYSLSPSFNNLENRQNRKENDGDLTLLRAGIGKKNDNHLHLSYLKGTNRKPYENRFFFNGAELKNSSVIHIASRYNIGKHFYAEGEYASSFSDIDRSQTGIANETTLASPLTYNSPSNSYSLKVGSKYPKTKAEVEVSKVGNSYYSIGSPFLRRDVYMINASLSRFIWKRYIQITSRVSTSNDNLSQTKGYTNYTQMALISSRLMYKKLPQLIISYSKNKSLGSWEEVNTTNTSLNTQKSIGVMHSYTFKEIRVSVSANYNKVSIDNSFSGNNMTSSITVNTINTSVDYKKINLTSIILYQSSQGFISRKSSSQESVISYRLKKITVGGSLGWGKDNLIGKKISAGFNFSGSLFKHNRVQLNIRKTYFTSHTINMMNPFTLNLNIIQKF